MLSMHARVNQKVDSAADGSRSQIHLMDSLGDQQGNDAACITPVFTQEGRLSDFFTVSWVC